MPAKEEKPMELNQAPHSLPTPVVSQQEIIPPQLWKHLTQAQQHWLLQTIALVCQELVQMPSRIQESEVTYE
jgi:hypothetical protein